MKAPWVVYRSALNNSLVEAINKRSEAYPPISAAIGYGSQGRAPGEDMRRSTVKWLDYRHHENHFIRSILMDMVKDANRNNWGFNVDWLQDMQYTIYEGNPNTPGHYNWHQDIFWTEDTYYQRKLSIVVQLSDPSEYVGGDFKIDPLLPQLNPVDIKLKGSVIIFPSFFLHKVEPVTAGIRKSLVSWIEGPRFT